MECFEQRKSTLKADFLFACFDTIRTRCTEIFSESHESCQTEDLFNNVDLSYHIEEHLIREMWTYKMAKYAQSFIFEIITFVF